MLIWVFGLQTLYCGNSIEQYEYDKHQPLHDGSTSLIHLLTHTWTTFSHPHFKVTAASNSYKETKAVYVSKAYLSTHTVYQYKI